MGEFLHSDAIKCHGINPTSHGLKRTTQSTPVNLALKKGAKTW